MSTEQAKGIIASPPLVGLPAPKLSGVHHTARPTWKLAETVHFYREIMGLEVVHAISARGWGPETHPDFLHFFFGSGNRSTIAFFYYLNSERPPETVKVGSWLYNSTHTAWQVDASEELQRWAERFERQGLKVLQVSHEIIDSIYVTDPNGYGVEISWQRRPLDQHDAQDALLTLAAAIELETEQRQRVKSVDQIWQRKSALVDAYLEKAD
jgi:catechol 2,3-dioxygenase-like lactoylglutathione lyase family enzyme